jgi:YHS domain-containing protein
MKEDAPEGYKQCSKCGEIKPVIEFYKKKGGKYSVASICKKCVSRKSKVYYSNNRERLLEYQEDYKSKNKEIVAEREKRYRDTHKEKIAEDRKKYYECNKDTILKKSKEYYEENKEQFAEKYYENIDENREYMREQYKKHKDNRLKYAKTYASCVKNPSCAAVGGRGAKFVILVCPVCGKEFRRLKSEVDFFYEYRGQTVFYCSRACSAEAQRKSHKSKYEKNITRIRKEQRL